jgi:hypothetical protein
LRAAARRRTGTWQGGIKPPNHVASPGASSRICAKIQPMRGALSSLRRRLDAVPKWWGRRVGLVGTRRGMVAVLLLGWLAVLLISAFTPHLQVCSDEVARVGSTALARTCGSLSFTDAPSLAVLVIVGLLLLPDLSSLVSSA